MHAWHGTFEILVRIALLRDHGVCVGLNLNLPVT